MAKARACVFANKNEENRFVNLRSPKIQQKLKRLQPLNFPMAEVLKKEGNLENKTTFC